MIDTQRLFSKPTFRRILKLSAIVSILLASIFAVSSQLLAEDKSDADKKKKSHDVGSIVRTGSTAELLSNNMAFDYMKIQPEAKISVKTVGAYYVWKSVIEKTSQLGVVAGSGPAPELEKMLHDQKDNLIIRKIGTVGMAVVVNKDLPVGDIALDDVIKIYTGEITNWSAVSGPDRPIHLYGPSPDEFTKTFVYEELLKGGKLITASQISRPSNQLNTILKDDPDGIGLIPFAGVGSNIKAILIDQIPPTVEQILAKKYPLTSELRVIYLDRANHTTHDFAKFLLTRKLNKKWLDANKIVGVEEVED